MIDRALILDSTWHKLQHSKGTPKEASKPKDKDSGKANSTSKPSKHGASRTPGKSNPKKSDEISKVLDPETGFLNADEKARREKEGLCMYCGGKHSMEDCAKRAAR